MTSLYLKANSSIIDNVLERAIKISGAKDKKNIEAYIRHFFQFSLINKLKSYKIEELAACALESYEFCKKRKKNEAKIRIYNPTLKKNGWEKQYTVIELVNDDMPFLVDSISEEINRQGYKIHYLTHPVLKIERTTAGVISKVESLTKEDDRGCYAESIIHFQISYINKAKKQDQLLAGINNVLNHVMRVVQDWPCMLKEIESVITGISKFANIEIHQKKSAYKTIVKDITEVEDFLTWLKNGNFTFFGLVREEVKNDKLIVKNTSKLGMLKIEDIWLPKIPAYEHIGNDILQMVHITKSTERSKVHRSGHMDLISIAEFDEKGELKAVNHILGMFTSIVYYQSAQKIPLLRRKIDLIQRKSGFSASGHSAKALIAVLEDFPRDELFQTPVDELYETAMVIVTLTTTPRVKLFIRKDDSERFISVLVFMPRERYNTALRQQIEAILSHALDGVISNYFTQVTDSHLARLQVIIKTKPGKIPKHEVSLIEEKIEQIARLWSDDLLSELEKKFGENEGGESYTKYSEAFSPSYTNRFSAQDAYYDILKINEVLTHNKTTFDLYLAQQEADENILHLKIYSPKEQASLSKIMPILVHLGVNVIDEHTYQVSPKDEEFSVWIHRFRFTIASQPKLKEIKENFEEALDKLWNEEIQNDSLNKLIVCANIKWREVVLLRAYIKYLQQLRFSYSQDYIQEALSSHPKTVKLLIDLFMVRFDPEYKQDRERASAEIVKEIEKILSLVSNIAEDKVIRTILDVLMATWRTNYFQKTPAGDFKSYISFKLNSAKISFMPKPRPYTEIYVYSPRVSGIHLRGGKVARGGLRWSDRREDFRTEVLGLMKAQMTKNAVIIPVGSKGGFVVKKIPTEGGRDAMMKEGIECYKTFLRGLLDLTDNLVNGKVKHPDNVVRYDGDDTYLVVAADKGTATFSDIANSVAAEYNFWLGDAFASGGSVGYDHKKMGITAKGAWISVERHFKEMGIDTDKDEFSAVGIGDMSGDVFGNGLLRSNSIKLVAAFNHMHIFLDPNPDSKKSFKERSRLFALPRSSWTDYDKSLISKGGGIFERSAKSIKISAEMKKILNVDNDTFNPDDLIQAILKAPIDLLWNGGIGTYVKSKIESNEMVGDKANDNLRVNGEDLRFKVIGEGGNLGFTQLGRIEYAEKGGRINTDAVDNSAGVDCSDHEVNIKIALNIAINAKKLTKPKRNKLLEEMTDDVAELVLNDNRQQTQFLTIAQAQGSSLIEGHARAIVSLEREGLLDRKVEFLPTKEEIAKRKAQHKGLTRPEISVLMAYSKISLFDELIKTKLPNDEYYLHELESYFPEAIRTKYLKEIHNHPLKREIIATSIANNIVNRIGIVVFYLLKESVGMEGCDIARAYTVVRDVYHLPKLWKEIEDLKEVPASVQIELFLEIRKLIEFGVLWLLKHSHKLSSLTDVIEYFSAGVVELKNALPAVLPENKQKHYALKLQYYKEQKVPESTAKSIAMLQALNSAFNIVDIAMSNRLKVTKVAEIYYALGDLLHLSWLREQLDGFNTDSYWQKTSIKTMIDDIFLQQKNLTVQALKAGKNKANLLNFWADSHNKQIGRYLRFIDDLRTSDSLDFSMIMVTVSKLKEIVENG